MIGYKVGVVREGMAGRAGREKILPSRRRRRKCWLAQGPPFHSLSTECQELHSGPPSISPDLYANTLTKKIALDNGSATVSKDAALTTTYEICFPHSYLPSDGEGLGSVGRSGHFKRGPLWHLLLRVHHHGLTRAGAKIHMRRNWLS